MNVVKGDVGTVYASRCLKMSLVEAKVSNESISHLCQPPKLKKGITSPVNIKVIHTCI